MARDAGRDPGRRDHRRRAGLADRRGPGLDPRHRRALGRGGRRLGRREADEVTSPTTSRCATSVGWCAGSSAAGSPPPRSYGRSTWRSAARRSATCPPRYVGRWVGTPPTSARSMAADPDLTTRTVPRCTGVAEPTILTCPSDPRPRPRRSPERPELMAKQTDKKSPNTAGPAKPKKQPRSSGRIRNAVASAGPAGLVRRITRPRRVTFTPSTYRIAGPLSFTKGGMFATFVLGGQQWDFRSDSDRTLLWDQATYRWASLKGRSVKLRSTPRPYPSYEFARTLDEDTPSPLRGRAGRPVLGRLPGVRAATAAADRAGHQDGHPLGLGWAEPQPAGPGGADPGRGASAAGDRGGDRARSSASPTLSRARASTAGRSGRGTWRS